MLDKIVDFISGKGNDLKDKLFRCVVLVGVFMVTLGVIESIFVDGMGNLFFTLIFLLISMIIAVFLTFKINKAKYVAVVIVFLVDFIVFPEMFRSGGGITGAGTAWFACGIAFIFFIAKGRNCFILTLAVMGMNAYMYHYGYAFPEKIQKHRSIEITYIDSFFSQVVIGMAVGLMIVFMRKIYDKEREVVMKQNKEIEAISNSRSMFFTNMSHELRTPITTIIGCNELIERAADGNEEMLKYSENIRTASKMLLSLVNDIIDMSKIEQNRMDIVKTEYNVKKMFREIVEIAKVQADNKGLELDVDIDNTIPYLLNGDEKRIKQVLINLLINGVKYTNEGTVKLEVRKEKIEENKVYLKIVVKDTGVGIKKDSLNKIFESLTRVNEKENYQIEGSGLGLAISKQLIERMGGNITVDSVYSKGSTFTVYIEQEILDMSPIRDIKDNVSLNTAKKYNHSFESSEARLLIVDDNYTNADIMKKLLEKTKMHIDIVSDSKSCLDLTRKKMYHIIIFDYLLQDMNGGELMKMVRNQENGLCKKAMFMVATAVNSSEIKQIVNNYDFDGFLEKPINPRVLEESIYNLLPEEIIDYTQDTVASYEKIFSSVKKKKKKKVVVTTDSLCSLSKATIERYGIKVMYTYVISHKGRFADMREVDAEGVLTFCASFEGAQANKMYIAGASVEEFEQFFAETLMEADDIIHISVAPLSRNNSNSMLNTALEAAKSFDHVHVVDSQTVSSGQAILTLQAAKMAQKGFAREEILNRIVEQKKNMVSRCFSNSALLMAENGLLSKFKAQIYSRTEHMVMYELRRGRIVVLGNEKGDKRKAIKKYIRKLFMDNKNIDRGILYITHVGYTVSEVEFLKNEISRYVRFGSVIAQKASISVACKIGINSMELSYIQKRNDVGEDEKIVMNM